MIFRPKLVFARIIDWSALLLAIFALLWLLGVFSPREEPMPPRPSHLEACPKCNGSGQLGKLTCPACCDGRIEVPGVAPKR